MDVHRPRLDVGVVVPQPREDRVAGDDPSAVLHEVPQQVELLLGQANGMAADGDPEARPVDPQAVRLEHVAVRLFE